MPAGRLPHLSRLRVLRQQVQANQFSLLAYHPRRLKAHQRAAVLLVRHRHQHPPRHQPHLARQLALLVVRRRLFHLVYPQVPRFLHQHHQALRPQLAQAHRLVIPNGKIRLETLLI